MLSNHSTMTMIPLRVVKNLSYHTKKHQIHKTLEGNKSIFPSNNRKTKNSPFDGSREVSGPSLNDSHNDPGRWGPQAPAWALPPPSKAQLVLCGGCFTEKLPQATNTMMCSEHFLEGSRKHSVGATEPKKIQKAFLGRCACCVCSWVQSSKGHNQTRSRDGPKGTQTLREEGRQGV